MVKSVLIPDNTSKGLPVSNKLNYSDLISKSKFKSKPQ